MLSENKIFLRLRAVHHGKCQGLEISNLIVTSKSLVTLHQLIWDNFFFKPSFLHQCSLMISTVIKIHRIKRSLGATWYWLFILISLMRWLQFHKAICNLCLCLHDLCLQYCHLVQTIWNADKSFWDEHITLIYYIYIWWLIISGCMFETSRPRSMYENAPLYVVLVYLIWKGEPIYFVILTSSQKKKKQQRLFLIL